MATDETETIEASCHCGNIRFSLHWPTASVDIQVRECSCTFCQKHGGAWTSNRESSLEVSIDDRSLLSEYQFGTATAVFHVCKRCGVVPLVTSEIDGHVYAVVNTNTFNNKGQFTFSRSATDFEGEGVGDRLDRRSRNWISVVRFS
jgi:hypothetical protein